MRVTNRDQIEGNWKVLRGTIQEKWGKLTDDHLDIINGRLERLAGSIQQAYGISVAEAERQVHEWTRSFDGRVLTRTTDSKEDQGSGSGGP